MTRNITFSKKGKAYDVKSYNIVCRRSIPTVCLRCGEAMYEVDRDELRLYDIVSYECRNNHLRTVFIGKEV